MKKLFEKVGKKKDNVATLVGKTVMVGQYNVRVESLVGEGGFASIYKARDNVTGMVFALKHMRLQADSDAIKEVQHEAKTMAKLKGHVNVLKLHAVAFAGPTGAETDGFMLLDFCPVTLLEVMQRANFELDDYLVFEVFSEVCQAVAHMHRCNPPLTHRDLKAENVLKNSEGHWVICDFGSATARAQVYDSPADIAAEEDNIRRTTTPAYRAPEMWDLFSRQRIDTKVDVWALGVMLFVLAYGKLPFQGDSKLSILYGKYDMPPGRPQAIRSLIQDMLVVNPSDRPDMPIIVSRLDEIRKSLSMTSLPASPMSSQGSQPMAAPAAYQGPPAPAATPALSRGDLAQAARAHLAQAANSTPHMDASSSPSLARVSPALAAAPAGLLPQQLPQQRSPHVHAASKVEPPLPLAAAPALPVHHPAPQPIVDTLIDFSDSAAANVSTVTVAVPSTSGLVTPAHSRGPSQSGHNHKRSLSLNKQGFEQTQTAFDSSWADWGEQPAFGKAPSITTTALPPQAAAHHAARLEGSLSRNSRPAIPHSTAPTSNHTSASHSRTQSNGEPLESFAPSSANHHVPSKGTDGLASEVDALRLHVKGLVAQNHALTNRVIQLEDTVRAQSLSIQQLQKDVTSMNSQLPATTSDVLAPAQPGTLQMWQSSAYDEKPLISVDPEPTPTRPWAFDDDSTPFPRVVGSTIGVETASSPQQKAPVGGSFWAQHEPEPTAFATTDTSSLYPQVRYEDM